MPQKPRTLSEQEFNTIKARVLSEAPAGMDEATFQRWIAPRMAAALIEAEHTASQPEGSAVSRFVSGAADVLNPVGIVKGIAGAVAHPIDTLSNIGASHLDQGRKAIQAVREGRPSEAIGHGMAAALPILGPVAAEAGEQIAAGDVAGGLGKATGLLVPTAGPAAIRATSNAARRVIPAAAREAMAGALEEGAASRVADVISPKVGANKTRFGNRAAEVAPELAKNPETVGGWSRSGLHDKVQAAYSQAERALDEASDARLSARTFQTQPVIDSLLKKRQQLTAQSVEASKVPPGTKVVRSGDGYVETVKTSEAYGRDVVPGPNRTRVEMIDQAIEELRQLGTEAPYESFRRIRQAYDGPAKAQYSPSMTADYMKVQGESLGAADVTGTLREHLGRMDPRTAQANAEYSLYRTADEVLQATAEVERTRPKVGRAIVARMSGTILGHQAGGVPGAVAGYVLGPTVDAAMSSGWTTKLQTARLMNRLATAIRRGSVVEVTSLTLQLKRLGVQAAAVTGRAQGTGGTQVAPEPAR